PKISPEPPHFPLSFSSLFFWNPCSSPPDPSSLNEWDNRAKASNRQEHQDTNPLDCPLTWRRFVTLVCLFFAVKVELLFITLQTTECPKSNSNEHIHCTNKFFCGNCLLWGNIKSQELGAKCKWYTHKVPQQLKDTLFSYPAQAKH
ncbi:hypothetical protein ABEO75_16565, partial [Paenibacillus macerans]